MRKPQEGKKQTIEERKVSWTFYDRDKNAKNKEEEK
jgi:hypothetical protein